MFILDILEVFLAVVFYGVFVITRFWAAYGCYPCYNNPEGNTFAATEFVRLLEVSGSITAKQSTGTRENTHLAPSVEFNPVTITENVARM